MLAIDNQNRCYEPIMIGNTVYIKREEIGVGVQYLELRFSEWDAMVGDPGYYLIADYNKLGSYLRYFKEMPDSEYILKQNMMPIVGVKNQQGTYLIIAEGMKNAFHVKVGIKDNRYYIAARFELGGDAPYEDISFLKVDLGIDSDYSDMARFYRRYQLDRGACTPLKERAKNNLVLKYGVDSVEIRIRMGWKPAPSTVLEQTIENEPDMKVACTFDRVKNIIDELKIQGIDKAQLCLVGWNKSGHDGRWPQIFPVEEKLGGELKLRELIRYAQDNGYQIICHTNSTDAYHIAEDFSEDIVVKKKDGTLSSDELVWSGGRMYHLCPYVSREYAKRDLPKVADLGFRGLHYIDVMSVVPLRKCYDERHPATEADTEIFYKEIGDYCKSLFGGFASEGAFDFAASYLDYALYVTFGKSGDIFFDKEIPFWQMVYHGIILSNPSTATVNYPVKAPENRMKLAEYGGRPSFYFNSKFLADSDLTDWLGEEDIGCRTEQQIKEAVGHIKSAYEEYKKYRHLQYEFMEKHREVAPGVYEVTYSDGTVMAIDYQAGQIRMMDAKE